MHVFHKLYNLVNLRNKLGISSDPLAYKFMPFVGPNEGRKTIDHQLFNHQFDGYTLYKNRYILIHPCILGNRGVITKILTSPRHL